MAQRVLVKALQACQRGARSGAEIAAPQGYAAHTHVRVRIVRIHAERLSIGLFGLVPTAQPPLQVGGLEKEPRPGQVRFLHALKAYQRVEILALRRQHLRVEIIHHRRQEPAQPLAALELPALFPGEEGIGGTVGCGTGRRGSLQGRPLRLAFFKALDGHRAQFLQARLRLLELRPARPVQFHHDAAHFRHISQRLAGNKKVHRIALLVGIVLVQLAEDLERFAVTAGILVSFAQVVAQLGDGIRDGLLQVLVWPLDIAERDQLLERFARSDRIEPRVWRMAPILARHIFPARNGPCLRRLLEGPHQHFAIHVGAYRQTEQREQRGRNVQHAGAVQQFVLPEAWPGHYQNAEIAVFDGRSGWNQRDGCGPQMVGMETMVRHQDHVDILAGVAQERAQHLVVELVAGRHDVFVDLEIGFRNAFLPWRMVAHEPMAEMVDRVIVNREEVPFPVLQQPGCGGVHTHAFAQNRGHGGQAVVCVQIDLPGARHEVFDHDAVELVRMQA